MVRRVVSVVCASLLLIGGCSDDTSGSDAGPPCCDSSNDGAPSDGAGDQPTPTDGLTPDGAFPSDTQARLWIHAGETSAMVYFTTGSIETGAKSYVEYGETTSYGQETTTTTEDRWAQLHRITGLTPATTYHFRAVLVTAAGEVKSADKTLTTASFTSALRVPKDVTGPPYKLDKDNQLYVLTQDISAPGTAVEVVGSGATLELDGHTVTFGASAGGQVFGIHVKSAGPAVVRNGHVKQGAAAGDYSSCVESRWRAQPTEVFGVTTEVSRPNGYPLRLFGNGQDAKIHHNHLYSTVTKIESRHYPGNDLLRVDASGPNIAVHDNLLTEGTHRGITVSGQGAAIEISYNDIRHHARFVNGYALGCAADGMKVHHNRVTSTGRGVHLTRADIELHDNFLDIKGHMTLDDMPQGSGTWTERRVELHGIKLEGAEVKGAKIHGNRMRIVQPLPDASWDYVPATPLNVACYDPDAMNEIHNNTFISLTEYSSTKHGPYGASGQWATAIYLVSMTGGAASSGKYSAYIHDNTCISNDIFVGADAAVTMTVRVEQNTFTLATTPSPTAEHQPFYKIGAALEQAIKAGGNTFQGMQP